MTAYALGHLHTTSAHPDIAEYLDRIQATLDPHGGRFLVHGAPPQVLEGEWPGVLVLLEFPDAAAARAWYSSPGYRAILPLRTRHLRADVLVVEGVAPGYEAAHLAAAMRAGAPT
ncbi:uncharacterized protein (DUF1330 family) [Kineococcus xinjiangensis]|uniref:Uncharacterized protein (DUF1330 family) n=1 Tax=Kineococcus xinjiangensis TaxID=512762 RepID=A0A2S6IPP5_9ACTN|nr:DUF1330 domain-containing protein [Kineococcus xinjiangensis]PPK96110.1 uncharacterized protein (DUF1330 family) [Kineococcus xinjiangensis]